MKVAIEQTLSSNLRDRVQHYARKWGLEIEQLRETESSVIAFVSRSRQALVMKVVKRKGDEWRSGEIVRAFAGHGVVRVYEHAGGALLLERLQPGNSLAKTSLNGRDDEATEMMASVIEKMSRREAPPRCPTVEDWGQGFERYRESGDEQIPRRLADTAQQLFADLSASQPRRQLLHGDLNHYNVLFDSQRGWLAIDPKGVVGEREYEIGAVLRNPTECPEAFLSPATIKRRLDQLTGKLDLDRERTIAWAFAQAVLSAIWDFEDGHRVDAMHPSLRLAGVIEPMLKG